MYSFRGYLLFGSLNPVVPEPLLIDSGDGCGVVTIPTGGLSGIGGFASFSGAPTSGDCP